MPHPVSEKPTGNGFKPIPQRLTPLQAIKTYCYQCSGENHAEVTRCVIPTCPLYPYRKGKSGRKRPDLRILGSEQFQKKVP